MTVSQSKLPILATRLRPFLRDYYLNVFQPVRRVRTRRVCRLDNVIKTTPLFQAVTFEIPVLVLIIMRGFRCFWLGKPVLGFLYHSLIFEPR